MGFDQAHAILMGYPVSPVNPDPRQDLAFLGVGEAVPGVVVTLVQG